MRKKRFNKPYLKIVKRIEKIFKTFICKLKKHTFKYSENEFNCDRCGLKIPRTMLISMWTNEAIGKYEKVLRRLAFE